MSIYTLTVAATATLQVVAGSPEGAASFIQAVLENRFAQIQYSVDSGDSIGPYNIRDFFEDQASVREICYIYYEQISTGNRYYIDMGGSHNVEVDRNYVTFDAVVRERPVEFRLTFLTTETASRFGNAAQVLAGHCRGA